MGRGGSRPVVVRGLAATRRGARLFRASEMGLSTGMVRATIHKDRLRETNILASRERKRPEFSTTPVAHAPGSPDDFCRDARDRPMPESLQWFADVYAVHGYWVLFLGIMLENAGIPLPGETALLAAAFLASPHAGGRLDLATVIVVAALAAIIGDNIGYAIGRCWARHRIQKGKRFLFLTPSRMQKAERYFNKYGVLTIFFGRFVALLRIAAGPAAGVAGMPWWHFFIANAAGAVVWSAAISIIGYYAG